MAPEFTCLLMALVYSQYEVFRGVALMYLLSIKDRTIRVRGGQPNSELLVAYLAGDGACLPLRRAFDSTPNWEVHIR